MKRKAINYICYFMWFVLWFGLMSCKGGAGQNGFSLQRFKVIDEHLATIIKGVCDSSYILENDNEVVILKLNLVDSVPFFYLTSDLQKRISENYIYSSNLRIVGYIEEAYLPTVVIVLSNINSRFDFEFTFYKFVVPTLDKKRFDYIYFPDNQYVVDEKGDGMPPPFFDPIYYIFEYKNDEIVPMTKQE